MEKIVNSDKDHDEESIKKPKKRSGILKKKFKDELDEWIDDSTSHGLPVLSILFD